MVDSQSVSNFRLEYEFPHPISAAYRGSQTAAHPTERLVALLGAVDATLRYLGTLLLADSRGRALDAGVLAELERNLRFPTLERWAETVFLLASQGRDAAGFIPELRTSLVGEDLEKTSLGRTLEDLAILSHELLVDRSSLVDEGLAAEQIPEIQRMLEEVLSGLVFLVRYPLSVFRSSQPAQQEDKPFQGYLIRWKGFNLDPIPIAVEFGTGIPEEVVWLTNEDATAALLLDPLIKLRRDAGSKAEWMHLFAGIREAGTIRLENHHSRSFMAVELPQQSLGEWLLEPAEHLVLTPSESCSHRLRFRSRLVPEEGTLDGRYEVQGFMGRGGLGAVYSAFDSRSGQDVAIKILYPDLSRNEFFARYFVNTGVLLGALDSPHLVPVFDCAYSPSLQENRLVMARMKGGSLAERLARRGQLPAREALEICVGVLRALEVYHEQQLIHGSVHPGNILFDEGGTVRLGDFGILKVPAEQVRMLRPMERVHSLEYAAPEVLLGGNPGPRCDLYSVGIVLYEMLTGSRPSKVEFVPPSAVVFPVPEGVDEILEGLLSLDIARRPASARELGVLLTEVLDSLTAQFDVRTSAEAQRAAGFLTDILIGHQERIDREIQEFDTAQDYEGMARALRLKIDGINDTGEKVFWMQKLARLLLDGLEDEPGAVEVFRSCQDLSPGDPAAVAALIAHYETVGEWEHLSRLLLELTEATRDRDLQVRYFARLAEIARDQLGNIKLAASYLEELVSRTEAASPWIEQLVELKSRLKDYVGAAEALERWVSNTETPERKVPLLKRLGALFAEDMRDVEAAVRVFDRILALVPDDWETLCQVKQMHRMSLNFTRLASTLRILVSSPFPSTAERLQLMEELGDVLSSYLYDSAEAEAVWKEVLELQPDHLHAMSCLERIYVREGQGDKYLQMLRRKADSLSVAPEKAEVLVAAANGSVRYLADAQGGWALMQEALRLAPGDEIIAEAARLFVETHLDVGAQAEYYLEQLAHERRAGQKLVLYRKLSQALYGGLGDSKGAFQVMKKAFGEFPAEGSVRRELERLALAGDAVEELLGFYLDELEQAQGETQSFLASRLAQLTQIHVKSSEKAVELLSRGAERTTDRHALVEALVVRYRELRDWPKLAVVLLHAIRSDKARHREEAFLELTRLILDELGDTPEGHAVLDQMVELLPLIQQREPLNALKEVCRGLNAWDRFTDIVSREVELEDDPDLAQRLRLQLAEVALGRNEAAKVVDVLKDALDKAPADPMVQDLLEQALVQMDDWEQLLALYRRVLPGTLDMQRRVSLMEKTAELEFAVFENMDGAIDLLRQLLLLQPGRREIRLRLAEALKKAERYTELAWTYEQLIHDVEPEVRKHLLQDMADIYYEKLANPDAAIQALRLLVRADPDNEELFIKVRDVCLAEKRYETLLRLLADRAQGQDGIEKGRTLVDMARLSAMDMGLLPPAREYLNEALQLDSADVAAFDLYREILERQEDNKELAVLLERRRSALGEGTGDQEVWDSLGLELAALYHHKLGRTVRATEILEGILEHAPEHVEAALMLADLYAVGAQWDKAAPLLMLLQSYRGSLEEGKARELLFLSGLTYEALLERTQAINTFRELLIQGYRQGEVRRKLASLLYLEEQHEEAGELISQLLEEGTLDLAATREFRSMLADIHRRLGRKERSLDYLLEQHEERPGDKEVLGKLVALMREDGNAPEEARFVECLLGVETDPDRRFTLLVRLGDVKKGFEGDGSSAVEAYERALEVTPEATGVLVALAELHLKNRRFEGAVETFGRAEKAESDPRRKLSLALTQGLIFADMAALPAEAIGHFRRALSYDPGHWDAIQALERLYSDMADWESLRQLYTGLLENRQVEFAAEQRYPLLISLSKLQQEKFGDTREAAKILEEAVALRPDDAEARSRLASLQVQVGDNVEAAVAQYRGLLAASPRDVNLLRMLRKAFLKDKRYDEAWCVTGVLDWLGAATEKDQQFYRKFLGPALKIKPATLDASRVREWIMHPDEDWELSEILRVTAERIMERLSLKSPRELGLEKKELLNSDEFPTFDKLVSILVEVLGINRPLVYAKEGGGQIRKEATWPPCLVVPRDALMQRKGKEIRFDLGYSLMLFRPEHAVVMTLDVQTLRSVLGNVLKLCVPSLPEPSGDPRQNAELRKVLEKNLSKVDQEDIRKHAASLRAKGSALSIRKWLSGVDRTAMRMGLVMANDLDVGLREARLRAGSLSSVSPDELETDLLGYFVSEEYARVRETLSMGISMI